MSHWVPARSLDKPSWNILMLQLFLVFILFDVSIIFLITQFSGLPQFIQEQNSIIWLLDCKYSNLSYHKLHSKGKIIYWKNKFYFELCCMQSDTGKTTGCYNELCPGFVQVSQSITLGIMLQTASLYSGPQYVIRIIIKQVQYFMLIMI